MTSDYKRLWELAERVSRIGYWEWDIQTGQTFWSRRKREIYGLDYEEEASYDKFLSLLDPSTRKAVEEQVDQVLAGTQKFYDLQHRIRLRNGREVWVHERAYLEREKDGTPRRMIGIVQDISAQKRLERELIFEKRRSDYFERYDSLTGLPNRHTLFSDLERKISSGTPFILASLDIEEFSMLNATFGHDFGDRILVELAARLEALASTGNAYRYGADEYMLTLSPSQSSDDPVAELRRHLHDLPLMVNGQELKLHYNIGTAHYPEDAKSVGELITRTASALSVAKVTPQINAVRFQPYMEEKITRHYHGLDSLREAIEAERFYPYYQPIVDVTTGRVVRVEALARWLSLNGEIFALPEEFLPLARDHHLIHRIDHLIMTRALKDLKTWHEAGLGISLACNAYLNDFTYAEFSPLFREYQKYLPSLIIEVSEEELLNCTEDEKERLEILRSFGIGVSIDDFGTGYSSLRYLQSLPVNELKIDRSFLQDFPRNPKDRALIQLISDISSLYHLDCVAEGVETSRQSEALKEMGIRLQQGYLFAQPMPGDRLLDYLRRES